jgi:hypothetical protein
VKYRLVGFDVDGTLVDRDLGISDRVREGIARMQAAGVRGCIVTGRMYRSALPFARTLGFDAPVICYQGASIVDPVDGARLREVQLSPGAVSDLIARAKRDRMHLQLYKNDRYYCESDNRFAELYAKVSNVPPIVVPSLVEEFAGQGATKGVVIADPAEAAAYAATLEAAFRGRAYITRSYPEFVEVLDPHVDKGAALRFVAERLNVPIEETAAIGDAWNDAPLLRAAGFGIAMGSAPDELRACADAVVGDVGEDGVVQAIDEYILA